VPKSWDTLPKYTKEVRALGVEIVDSIDGMLKKVDVVMLLSRDGRPHLEQVKPVFAAGKPVFIDKPVAASLADCIRIFQLAKQHNVPCFSSSSLRFSPGVSRVRNDPRVGRVVGCAAYSPNKFLEPSHPDLFYYGVHGVEILFTIMGPGCKSVTRVHAKEAELAVGVWEDGRIGTFRGIRSGHGGFGATVFGSEAVVAIDRLEGYQPLVIEIVKFFTSGKPPVSVEETLEIYAFMEAADESKRRGGCPVLLEEVLRKARRAAGDRADPGPRALPPRASDRPRQEKRIKNPYD